jgi:PKD repeat protein
VASNVCDSDSFCAQINICVAPTSSFTYNNSTPQSYQFTSTSTGNPTTYLWDFGDGQSSVQPNATNIYAAAGTYTVCLIVSDTCGSDTSCNTVLVNVIGVNDPNAAFQVELWPNPSQDRVTVKVSLPELGALKLRITDMAGRELFSLSPSATGLTWQQQLDLSSLAQGMYFLEVRSGDLVRTTKLMME